MRAAIFERQGLDNLNVKDVEQPTITDHDVLYAEVAGIIEKVGNHVSTLKEGDKAYLMEHVICVLVDMK